MLSKANRLKKENDFKRIFLGGKTIRGSLLTMRFAPNGGQKTRFGFVVGLRFSKKAVLRNKMKRQLSAAAEKHYYKIKPGYDIVVIPGNFTDAGQAELVSALAEALNKAGILDSFREND